MFLEKQNILDTTKSMQSTYGATQLLPAIQSRGAIYMTAINSQNPLLIAHLRDASQPAFYQTHEWEAKAAEAEAGLLLPEYNRRHKERN